MNQELNDLIDLAVDSVLIIICRMMHNDIGWETYDKIKEKTDEYHLTENLVTRFKLAYKLGKKNAK